MLKLPKKVEYAIFALQYIAENEDKLVSVKEISTNLHLSFEFLSKVMQVLNRKGLIQSQQGIKGGYKLTIEAKKLNIMDIIRAFDEKISLVDCTSDNDNECDKLGDCDLRNPMIILQDKIETIFFETSISDLSNKKNKRKFTELKIEY